jgi:tetratricopeptide (TPR) repeat protein
VNPDHLKLLAKAHDLDRSGMGPEALVAYQEFLALDPHQAEAWADYAGRLLESLQPEEAQKACERALELDPRNLSAQVNEGCILMLQGRLDPAEGRLRQVLVNDIHRIDARLALVKCLIKKGDLGTSEQELTKVIRQEPGNLSAHQFLGSIFYSLGRWSEFRAETERYRCLDPSSAYLKFELGFLDLLFGEMPRGWEQYQARWAVPGLIGPVRNFSQPVWNGEPFPGKTLLLYYEQGLGDTLMFVRYAPQVKALGGRVILQAQPALADLVGTCKGVDEVIPYGEPLPPFDLQLPLLSLPWVFRTDLSSIPDEIPYLDIPNQVPNRKVFADLVALAQAHGKTRIGLAWAGNPNHKRDAERSIPVATLAPLAALPEVAWFSFQMGGHDLPSLPNLISLTPLINDFSDTAYALSGMDLVITVDSVLAHLAGALGIPTLLLLSFQPDWRWMLDRDDSPWYPTLRIYRQPAHGDWDSVIRLLVRDLTSEQQVEALHGEA